MSVYANEYEFGAGSLWGTRTDVAGTTPQQFGTLQEVSISLSGDIKPLYGSFQYAIALARGKTTIEINPKMAAIQGGVYFDLYFGTTAAKGQTLVQNGEDQTITTGSATVSQGSLWLSDLGVYYVTTGQQLQVTLSATPATTGTYFVAGAGVYKFATADNSKAVSIGYSYNNSSIGISTTLTNPLMGTTPVFSTVFRGEFDGRQAVFSFTNCVAGKLTMPTKLDDWMIQDMTIQASANAAGVVGSINMGQGVL